MSGGASRLALAGVAIAGIAVASYLTYVHFEPEALVCTGGGGCERVQDSEYATTAGVPVALLGLLFWVAVAALLAWDRPAARTAAGALTLAGLGFAVYLVALQLFVIDAICAWCMVNDLLLVPAAAALAVLRLRSEAEPALR